MSAEPSQGGTLRLASRGSPLALAQSRMVAAALERACPGMRVHFEVIRTAGDRQQAWMAVPADLGAAGGKGLFVKDIEDALLEGRVDAAVHSMKDMPTDLPEGAGIVAVPAREDPRDVLVARGGLSFEQLPRGARLGTGSPRRIAQLRHVRPDLVFVPIRGNVETRLRKLDAGDFEGVVLAAAGLNRLGLGGVGRAVLSPDICLPAPGQGALAIEARLGEGWILDALRTLHDPETACCVEAERAFLGALGGGCLVPAAALAETSGPTLRLRVAVADPEGRRVVRAEVAGHRDEAQGLGIEAAELAASQGAAEILSSLRGQDRG